MDADYVKRLEAAFLDLKTANIWDDVYLPGSTANEHIDRAMRRCNIAYKKPSQHEDGIGMYRTTTKNIGGVFTTPDVCCRWKMAIRPRRHSWQPTQPH